MSSIAVFLVLGGATAFAAGNLGKNSVGTKQLKNGAVTGAKIKNGSVSGSKLKLATIGQVPSAANAGAAKTAETAATANTANTAKSAASAKFAETAASAETIGGKTVRPIFFSAPEGTERQVLSLDGLTLTAKCGEGIEPQLTATTAADSLLHIGIFLGNVPIGIEYDSFQPGETVDVLEGAFDSAQGSFTYARRDGEVVTATFAVEQQAFGEPQVDCLISGNAIG
jgi:hypothetical protein